MRKPITIVIAEDMDIYLDGLIMTLERNKRYKVIAHVPNGRELLEVLKTVTPDIVLVDVVMPVLNGVEACKVINNLYPEIAVVAMTVFEDEDEVQKMIQAGAIGFMMKNSDKEELFTVIESAYKGKPVYCSRTNRRLAEAFAERGRQLKPLDFSTRELEIMELKCDNLSHEDIADKLCMSVKTVDSYSYHMLQKIGEHNAVGLIRYAIRHGLYKVK